MIFHHGTTMAAEIQQFTNSIPELEQFAVLFTGVFGLQNGIFSRFSFGVKKKMQTRKRKLPLSKQQLSLGNYEIVWTH